MQYNDLWEGISIKKGDKITVNSKIGSKDGQEYSRGRWAGIIFAPVTKGKDVLEKSKTLSTSQNVGSAVVVNGVAQAATEGNAEQPVAVSKDGKGEVAISCKNCESRENGGIGKCSVKGRSGLGSYCKEEINKFNQRIQRRSTNEKITGEKGKIIFMCL